MKPPKRPSEKPPVKSSEVKSSRAKVSDSSQTRPKALLFFERVLYSKIFLIMVSVVICYAFIGFILAPYLVQKYVPRFVERQFNTPATIGSVSMNPFLLTTEVHDFSMKEQSGRPLAGFRRLFVNLQASSLFRWAWTFRSVEFDAPTANIVIEKNGTLNLAKLLSRSQNPENSADKTKDQNTENQKTDADKKGPPRILLYAIRIEDGKIDVTDMRQSEPATLSVEPLNVKLSDISTLPDREGPYTLEANTGDGGSFNWKGRITLQPFRSEGDLNFTGIKAASLWDFARDAVNLTKPAGTLNAGMHYQIDAGGKRLKAVLKDLEVRLTDIALTVKGENDPFLSLPEAALTGGRFDLTEQTVDVAKLSINGGKVRAALDAEGQLSLASIIRTRPQKTPAPKPAATAWNLNVDQVDVDKFGAVFTDLSRTPPTVSAVDKVHVSLQVSAVSGDGKTQLQLKKIESRIENTSVKEGADAEPVIRIPVITIESGDFDLAAKALTIGEIGMTGGIITVVRGKEGDINLVELVAPKKIGTIRKKGIEASKEGVPWHFVAQKIQLSDFQSSLTDLAAKPEPLDKPVKPVLGLKDISVELVNVDGKSPTDFSLSLAVEQGGRLSTKGTINPAGPVIEASLDLADLDVTPFQPYIDPYVDLEIASGRVSTSGTFRHGGEGPNTVYTGKVQADDLKLVETGGGATLMGWTSLHTSQTRLQLSPNQLAIDEIVLSQPVGKLFILEDRSVNLVKLIKPRGTGQATAGSPPKGPAGDASGFPVRISKIRIAKGDIDFADYSLTPNFAAEIRKLAGVIIGMSSTKNDRAQVQLDGQVNEYGSAKISGEVNTFNPKAFTDITMNFRNIEMPRLSPYSGKFAGRRIKSGKLSVVLEYKITDGQLLGNNKIIVNQLVLGEKVKSPEAVNLPLDLAVALLEDSSGVIDIGLPVHGDLNNPKFGIGQVVWKAFVNLITKIVTSPFRALGSLLGVEGESLDIILFEAGSTDLAPPEKEKLAKLLEALKMRPQLQVVVTGYYDSKEDAQALKELQVRRSIAEKRGVPAKAGEDPGPVDFSNPRVQKTIEVWYAERFGDDALKTETARSAVKGENEAPDPGKLAKALFEGLVDKEPIEPNVLDAIGRKRAEAVAETLVGPQSIPSERVQTKPPEARSGKNSTAAGLGLDVKPNANIVKK